MLNNNETDVDILDDRRHDIAGEGDEDIESKRGQFNKAKSILIGSVSGLALALVVGYVVLAPQYASDTDVEIPVVRRPQAATKVQPLEPGGMDIPNKDKSIYDIIEAGQDASLASAKSKDLAKDQKGSANVEKLLPKTEEVQLPQIEPKTEEPSEQAEAIVDVIEDAQPVAAVKAEPQKKAEISNAELAELVNLPTENKQPQEVKKGIVTEEVKPIEVKKEIKAQVKEEVKAEPKSAVPSGVWQVQLISSPNLDAVAKAEKTIVKKYPVIGNNVLEIETANLGAKGTYYRLKAGAFADRADADTLCNDIKALGGSCLVKKK